MLVTLTLSVIVPQNIDVKASADYGDPGIDYYGFVYNKTNNMSKIVFEDWSKDRGREFGEKGEQKAADYIEDWMDNIGFDDVYNETIDAVYVGEMYGIKNFKHSLNKKKTFDKEGNYVKLEIKVMDGCHVIETRSIDCFPFFGWRQYQQDKNVKVVEDFKWNSYDLQIVLLDADWRDPWDSWDDETVEDWILAPWCRGWILVDGSNDSINTRFMGPSQLFDFFKPGYSINNSDGSWIRSNMENYEVFATIKSVFIRDYVESYNVIGEINGIDNDTYSIV